MFLKIIKTIKMFSFLFLITFFVPSYGSEPELLPAFPPPEKCVELIRLGPLEIWVVTKDQFIEHSRNLNLNPHGIIISEKIIYKSKYMSGLTTDLLSPKNYQYHPLWSDIFKERYSSNLYLLQGVSYDNQNTQPFQDINKLIKAFLYPWIDMNNFAKVVDEYNKQRLQTPIKYSVRRSFFLEHTPYVDYPNSFQSDPYKLQKEGYPISFPISKRMTFEEIALKSGSLLKLPPEVRNAIGQFIFNANSFEKTRNDINRIRHQEERERKRRYCYTSEFKERRAAYNGFYVRHSGIEKGFELLASKAFPFSTDPKIYATQIDDFTLRRIFNDTMNNIDYSHL